MFEPKQLLKIIQIDIVILLKEMRENRVPFVLYAIGLVDSIR